MSYKWDAASNHIVSLIWDLIARQNGEQCKIAKNGRRDNSA